MPSTSTTSFPTTPGTKVRLLETELEKKGTENEALQNTIGDLTKALEKLTIVKDNAAAEAALSKTSNPNTSSTDGTDEKKKKSKKDPNAPEPAKTAYKYFLDSIISQKPAAGQAWDPRTMWKECQGEQRKQFMDLAAVDKERFQLQDAIYQKQLSEQQEEDQALEKLYETRYQQKAVEFYEAYMDAQKLVQNGKKKKPTKDPAAPKRPVSGFMHFAMEKREQIAAENPDMKVTEISKVLGEEWGKLEKGKGGTNGTKKYDDLAAKDKERYETEKKAYDLDQEQQRALKLQHDKEEALKMLQESKQNAAALVVDPDAAMAETKPVKKTKKVKPAGAPKKAKNAYNYFVMEKRAEIKASLPEAVTNQELLTEVGRQWKELDDAGRAPYAKLALQDKERYHVEWEAFLENGGEISPSTAAAKPAGAM